MTKNVLRFLLIIVLITNLKCIQNRSFEDIWITTGTPEFAPFSKKHLLEFKDDSLIVNIFFDLGNYNGLTEKTRAIKDTTEQDNGSINLYMSGTYTIDENQLIYTTKKYIDTFLITKQTKDTLKLEGRFRSYFNGEKGRLEEYTYIKLPKYKQAKHIQKLEKLLKKNLYTIKTEQVKEELKIDFWDGLHFQLSAKQGYLVNGLSWWIKENYGELFLVFDLASPYPLHIKSISEDKIIGIIHGHKDLQVELIQTIETKTWELTHLLGKWEEQDAPPPPPAPTDITFYDKEYLVITENQIIKHKWDRSDTLDYKIGKLNDFIIFPENWGEPTQRRWQITNLSKEELTIERMIRPVVDFEQTKFIRIE